MRVTVVATGLNRPSDFAAGARRSSMSRLAPGGIHGSGPAHQLRGGGLNPTPPQSVLRQSALQASVRAAPAPHPALRQPASNTGEDAQPVLPADMRRQQA
jgi:cell division protein FtsZ